MQDNPPFRSRTQSYQLPLQSVKTICFQSFAINKFADSRNLLENFNH